MTKEELKKEAEEYLKKKNYTSGHIGYFASGYCKQAYIDSAEPREKQIQIDAEQIRALQKQNGELTDKVKELEKENAELKEALKGKRCNCMTYFNFKDLEKQLTKAIEILKKYHKECPSKYSFEDIDDMAEQFLKENA